MDHEPLELSLVDEPQLRTARDVFIAASRCAPPPPVWLAGVAGCGWFDSSFDLQRGLEVKEGWPGEPGLRSWIDAFLEDQRGDARRTSSRTAAPRSMTAMA